MASVAISPFHPIILVAGDRPVGNMNRSVETATDKTHIAVKTGLTMIGNFLSAVIVNNKTIYLTRLSVMNPDSAPINYLQGTPGVPETVAQLAPPT